MLGAFGEESEVSDDAMIAIYAVSVIVGWAVIILLLDHLWSAFQ